MRRVRPGSPDPGRAPTAGLRHAGDLRSGPGRGPETATQRGMAGRGRFRFLGSRPPRRYNAFRLPQQLAANTPPIHPALEPGSYRMRALGLTGLAAVFLLAPPMRAEDKKADAKTYNVPYKMTKPQHIMVRAKINGKGPYNFIVDTGAPALFVSTAVCDKLGIKPDKKGYGTFDRFEIEGGVVLEKIQGRVEDPFQLKGMNAMNLAGAELHGMIGYTLLAKFKMEIDFTSDKMKWTPLDFEPPAPMGLPGAG